MNHHALKLFLVTIALVGCSPSTPDIDPYDSTLLGLYTIESWTENRDSCEVEGPSVLAGKREKRALVQACTVPNVGLHVVPCEDVAGCEREACDGSIFRAHPLGWDRLKGDDSDGWRGKPWRASERVDDHCRTMFSDVSLTMDGDTLVLRSRVFESDSYPLDATGNCSNDEGAVAAVEGKPCAALEVLRIRRDNADCDPLAPTACTDDELCVPYGRRFVCTPVVTPGQVGDPCDFESCAPGLLCVGPGMVPGCTTSGCCTDYCDASLPEPSQHCALHDEGVVCHPYYSSEYTEQPGREHVGLCGVGFECGDDVIFGDWVCDGEEDCEEGEDESDC